MELLSVKNLETRFTTRKGTVTAVAGVSFGVGKGEILGIVGESGCGKSVTSLSIMGLLPSSGTLAPGSSIALEGQELTALSEGQMCKMRGNRIAMIFQDPMTSLNPVMTIGRQMMEPLMIHQGMDRAAAAQHAVSMLEKVGIAAPERRMREYPHQFSGGMRQRIMIAMALSCNPALLIADEPTTALDVTIQAQVLELIRELRDDLGTAVMLITHDMGVVAEMADRILVMYAGKGVEYAPVRRLFREPLHPYTQGLLRSIPRLDGGSEELYTIRGQVPNQYDMPAGCRFCDRCPYAKEICRARQPDQYQVGDTLVSCWKYEGGGEYGE
ncbi:ABC transporter ATP-binding protein [Allofournierella sp.]|uniref:ABC transporter ATP-binding protein n=1 Tax=Allofournierella sp. TaxID=1940256 RepID=UPI003AB2F197